MVNVAETRYNKDAPLYRPTDEETEAIRIALRVGQWQRTGYPRDMLTLCIDDKEVNVEFRLIPLHDPFPGHGPFATWTVISEEWRLDQPRVVHKGDLFGNP